VSVNGINGATNDPKSHDRMPGTEDGGRMGQDAFLKLLTAQLQNQDPMKPQENGEFLAQLAQFTSLEKLTSMEASLKKMADAFDVLAGTGGSEGTDSSNNT
jgi:flagellar basal-body rod modification protein FlgD